MASDIILFLDFDGVLHPDPPTSEAPLFCRAGLLQQFLHQHWGVAVVVSSTWRKTRTLEQLQGLFPGWSDRVIGATSESIEANYTRQFECEAWMRENVDPWTPWVALDDRPWNFRPFEQRLVLVERSTGLTISDLERLSNFVLQLSN
nr:HAD domain-containing protein [uncultured Rhodoferax sp.]